ncbi:hypothetical protein [Clostridium fallax]|uniref:Uncharacterized protein n=1 Tax=Clostridium fallax TaxID=1533 RepID=A0A1M4TLI1_9CLOT|nr:hypothetical protein [Clostridium fallax]SHE45343.1 hypothetical protein SAMN05443638_1037 [Clostridium fallax]SQB22506.1 Uncharacterised protein [Clostridium fallax]
MHRELIKRRKSTTIISSVVVLCAMIFLANIIGRIKINNSKLDIYTDPLLAIITTAFLVFELFQCKVKYKYSIIADKLMIHKIISDEEKILEKIRLSDIVYIGNNSDEYKKYNASVKKKYICNTATGKNCCCVYKLGDNYRKVYFQPSSELINKIIRIKDRYKRVI